MYIAHVNDKNEIQTVKEHSVNTAVLAKEFAIDPLKNILYGMGLLHDIGKYQTSFQLRIKGNKNIKIPHALCGAKEVDCLFRKSFTSILMQYCISGHHAGIHNFGTGADTEQDNTLCGTLRRETEDYSAYSEELKCKESELKAADEIGRLLEEEYKSGLSNQKIAEIFAFLTRYAFSCLTDADSIDTQKFCQGEYQSIKSDFISCLDKLNRKFEEFTTVTPLQKTRQILQNQVYERLDEAGKIYLMNMPTGSGKTLCSIKWALEKAIETNKKRIIYIIPYNSIIDQTANVFEGIFGKDLNILRHQSTFQYENDDNPDEEYQYKKACENWDADFIITTAVQFFESIYANKRGKLRKLHNMADSILIFDEAHLMPVEFLQPCLNGIFHITHYLNSEAVFLTGTMPNFQSLLNRYCSKNHGIVDLVPNKKDFHMFFKCDYEYVGQARMENILNYSTPSKLMVVNSKKAARELYENSIGEKYHLSTYMIGKDRIRVISEIKERLKLLDEEFDTIESIPENRQITVISTSLIEAGVDLDFHTVYRELTGLDSILQSGGRCNREGRRNKENSKVYVFELAQNKLQYNASIAKDLFREFEDINQLECIEKYYERIFEIYSDEIIKNELKTIRKKPYSINFKDYAESFKIIQDENAVSIIVPCDEYSMALMEETQKFGVSNLRKLQLYMASIKIWEFEELRKQGVLEDFNTGAYFLTNTDYYNKEIGILFHGKDYFI
ncbi:MAG TPA: CRISPR-associated helicase/endonuclease Cas3 [Lachnospiraceae bacterium]|nr:CRISPR-associated helicase/endonuclease Cas3 [Lachnospiraceae bacterium]